MSETYTILNATRGSVSFRVHPLQSADELNAMAGHHRRKAIRSAAINVSIPHGVSVDLVEKTGLTVKELKNSPELHKLIRGGSLREMETKLVVEAPVVEEVVVEEPVIEDSPLVGLPTIEEPVVEEKAKKKSKKKSKKK